MIRKLPQQVINEISAGQVIQRPVNVIKELLENSIDAGATQINITIQQGGLQIIKISDNGKGIMLEDFPLLCARFATSKIKDFNDMSSLASFGFRGEALASLSYVSNLTISSKWHQSNLGHQAIFKNQQIVGNILDVPMNVGTTITASDLFIKSESRRASLNPMQEKKRIYKLLSHFCLHYPKIRFCLITDKGDEGLPRSKTQSNLSEAKMQIFQQISKLSYDKFCYIAPTRVIHSIEIEAIITKINCCKGKTLMLNINNRIVENSELFKSIEKAYSECYQSIHEQNQSFLAYLSLNIEPKLIDCNVHPTKKAVGIFGSQQVFEKIKQIIINQIKKDSAIKIIKPSQAQKNLNIQEAFKQKMGLAILKDKNIKQSQADSKGRELYAYEKNRTDCKQLPITFYSQTQTQKMESEIQKPNFFQYIFDRRQRDLQIKDFFSDCTYVGSHGLSTILLHHQDKLYLMNIFEFLPAFIVPYSQNNKFWIKQAHPGKKISEQIEQFISKTKLLPGSKDLLQWLVNQQPRQLLHSCFGVKIEGDEIVSYPCISDMFIETINIDHRIGWEVAYLIVRVYNAARLDKLSKELRDKFFIEFIKGHFFQERDENLSPFNVKISSFFESKVIPILKTNPCKTDGRIEIKKYIKKMLDLKDIYVIFQRC